MLNRKLINIMKKYIDEKKHIPGSTGRDSSSLKKRKKKSRRYRK